MKTPGRSVAIARALASEADGLPEDFAAQVASLAEAGAEARSRSWGDAALLAAFLAMVGICMVGWRTYGSPESGIGRDFSDLLVMAASQPLLMIGIAGVGLIQVLSYRGRVMIRAKEVEISGS
jgi:hypothetical protein